LDTKIYEKLIKEGERTEWYGKSVPKDLLTNKVLFASQNLHKEIDSLKSKLTDLRGTGYEKLLGYIEVLENNLSNLPYSLNRIEQEVKKEEIKKHKTTKKKKVTSKNKATKNSNLIFGNK
jgi:hypothetical protein